MEGRRGRDRDDRKRLHPVRGDPRNRRLSARAPARFRLDTRNDFDRDGNLFRGGRAGETHRRRRNNRGVARGARRRHRRMDYVKNRFAAFSTRRLDPEGIGFQIKQSLIAVGKGGFFGEGLEGATQRFGYLPEVQSDAIFAATGEAFGFFGSVIFTALFLLVAYRGFRIAAAAPDRFGQLAAVGLSAALAGQAFVHIGVNIALLPYTRNHAAVRELRREFARREFRQRRNFVEYFRVIRTSTPRIFTANKIFPSAREGDLARIFEVKSRDDFPRTAFRMNKLFSRYAKFGQRIYESSRNFLGICSSQFCSGFILSIFFRTTQSLIFCSSRRHFFIRSPRGGFFSNGWLDEEFDTVVITSERIIDTTQSAFVSIEISSADLDEIRDVSGKVAGFLGGIFRFGNLSIQTASAKNVFFMNYVKNPEGYIDTLIELKNRYLAKKKRLMKKYFWKIFGCAMNYSDAERVAQILKKAGFERTENVDDADLFLIFSCVVRQKAEDRIFGEIEKLKNGNRRNPGEKSDSPAARCGELPIGIRKKRRISPPRGEIGFCFSNRRFRKLSEILATHNSQLDTLDSQLATRNFLEVEPARQNRRQIFVPISTAGCDNFLLVLRRPARPRARNLARPGKNFGGVRARGGQRCARNHAARTKCKFVSKKKRGAFAELLERVAAIRICGEFDSRARTRKISTSP